MMNDTIRGVIFDIGGVLVALDGVAWLAKLLSIEESHQAVHELWMTSSSVVAHETGRLSASDFAAGVVADLNLPITPDLFLEGFITWPRFVLPGAFELLEAIPKQYHVAALSNTSAVHWERISTLGLADCFSRAYLSHEMGCLKPAEEAFLYAVNDMGLRPSEVVFLDDGVGNVNAARGLGFHAHLAADPQQAASVLADYGIVAVRG